MSDRDYHMERVRAELDRASHARGRAAEAHYRLSALHMQRLRELDEIAAAPLLSEAQSAV